MRTNNTNIKIIQWNCKGFRSKINELKYLISFQNPDVICLNETNLHLNDDYRICLQNFTSIEPTRKINGRGVAILINNKLQFSPLYLNSINLPIEIVGVKIMIDNSELIIFTTYISPSFSVNQIQINQMFDKISQLGSSIIINGDFNAHNLLWGGRHNDNRGLIIENAIDSYNFVLINDDKPTFFCSTTHSNLDLTFTSPGISSSCFWDTFNDLLQSDHCPTITNYSITTSNCSSFIPSIFPKQIDANTFIDKFEGSNLVYDDNSHPDINYNLFLSNLSIAASYTPKNNKKVINSPAPWWSTECSKAVAERRRALSKLKSNFSRENYNSWKAISSNTKNVLKEQKLIGWKKYCSSLNPNTNISDVWASIRRFKGNRVNNNSCLNPSFDRVMHDFGTSLSGTYGPFNDYLNSSPFKGYISCPLTSNFFDSPFTFDEINVCLKSLKNTSPGLDSIRNSIIKLIPFNGLSFLLNLFNNFYEHSFVPECWRDFEIIPILKPGKRNDEASSYRPIAKVSCLRKLFEKLLKNRLDYFLETNNILPDSQYGFRRGRSTMDSITLLWTSLSQSIDSNSVSISAFIDVTGAFDHVNIDVLISHLASLNLPSKLTRIMYELFKYKNFHFNILKDSKFILKSITGLPQGSCLSPTLYEIYCSEIEKNIVDCKILQFADDICLTCVGNNFGEAKQKLQSALNILSSNLLRLNLQISLSKTKAVIFSRYKLSLNNPPPLMILNNPVSYVDHFCFLGFSFSYNLSNKIHIDKMVGKCKKLNNILKAVSGVWWGADPRTLLIIYKGLIRPVLDYGAIIYQDSPQSELIKVDRIQYAALRTALGAFRSTHVLSLEAEANIMPLKERRLILTDKICLKYIAFERENIIQAVLKLLVCRKTPLLSSRLNELKSFNIHSFSKDVNYLFDYEVNVIKHTCVGLIDKKPLDGRSLNSLFINLVNKKFFNFTLVFSDGSKDAENVSCAYTIPSYGIEAAFSLNPLSSIFSAEGTAILEALKMIIDLKCKTL